MAGEENCEATGLATMDHAKMRAFRSATDGAVLAEMAVIVPLLLALVFGVEEYGRLFLAQTILQRATYAAARCGAVYDLTIRIRTQTTDLRRRRRHPNLRKKAALGVFELGCGDFYLDDPIVSSTPPAYLASPTRHDSDRNLHFQFHRQPSCAFERRQQGVFAFGRERDISLAVLNIGRASKPAESASVNFHHRLGRERNRRDVTGL